jgi:hypothetical protein
MHWLDDYVNGKQTSIAVAAAALLPVESLAHEAESAGMWWSATLRWCALGTLNSQRTGSPSGGSTMMKRALAALANVMGPTIDGNKGDAMESVGSRLESMQLYLLLQIMKNYDPADGSTYGNQLQELIAVAGCRISPIDEYAAVIVTEMMPAMAVGNTKAHVAFWWKLARLALIMNDETSSTFKSLTDEDDKAKVNGFLSGCMLISTGDDIQNCDTFSWDWWGPTGEKLIEAHKCFVFEEHHDFVIETQGADFHSSFGNLSWGLTMHFGRYRDAVDILQDHPTFTAKIMAAPVSPGYALDYIFAMTFLCMNYYVHGLNELAYETFKMLDITFDTVDEIIAKMTEAWCLILCLQCFISMMASDPTIAWVNSQDACDSTTCPLEPYTH